MSFIQDHYNRSDVTSNENWPEAKGGAVNEICILLSEFELDADPECVLELTTRT